MIKTCSKRGCNLPRHKNQGYCHEHLNEYQREWRKKQKKQLKGVNERPAELKPEAPVTVENRKIPSDTYLSTTVFSMPIDGGRLAVKFHTPRLLSQTEWNRVLQWLDLIKSGLTKDAPDLGVRAAKSELPAINPKRAI